MTKRQKQKQKAQISQNIRKLNKQSCFILKKKKWKKREYLVPHRKTASKCVLVYTSDITVYHVMFHTYVHNDTQPTCLLIKCEYNISFAVFEWRWREKKNTHTLRRRNFLLIKNFMKIDLIQRIGTKAENNTHTYTHQKRADRQQRKGNIRCDKITTALLPCI